MQNWLVGGRFSRCNAIPARDRRTERQTDRQAVRNTVSVDIALCSLHSCATLMQDKRTQPVRTTDVSWWYKLKTRRRGRHQLVVWTSHVSTESYRVFVLVQSRRQNRHRRTVQSYSLGGAMCPPVWAHWRYTRWIWLNSCFLWPTRVDNPNGKSMGSAISAQLTAESPYTLGLQWATLSSKLAPSHGDFESGPHLTNDTLGRSELTSQTASQSVQPFSHKWP